MSVSHVPVVIVGAGPTGVTAATLLAQYGISCLVLDRWTEVYPQPRAVHLDDEVYRILARLGVAEEFAAISRPARGLQLRDNTHAVLAEFTRDTGESRNGYPQANMFDQPELEALLRTNLQRYPHAVLRGNVEVTGIAQDWMGVRVTYADRTTQSVHTVDADYVLGCDGANSITRGTIGSSMRSMRFDQRWLVLDIATAADLGQWDGVHQVCDPVRAGTFMQISPVRYRWEFRLLDGETADDYRTVAALRPLIAPWLGTVADHELDLIRVTEYTFRAQLADRWRTGRIFLLGDSAHLTPPFIGQGMGAGLRDAMNLTWKLAAVLAGDLPDSILDSYEQERKPHAQAMIHLALLMGAAMTAGGDIGNLLRRLLVPRLQWIPALHDRVKDSATPALRRSALVEDSHWTERLAGPAAHHRLAGTLCPNELLAHGNRLDTDIGRGFALITTDALDETHEALVRGRGARVHVAAPTSALFDWLRRGRARAAIVRPDRTVMKAGNDLDALCTTMPTFHIPEALIPTSKGAHPWRQ
ncbi:bifunctional 3-(3-hydroxy-phenyl)propionate/3-hydroxycinnamic acid hydroxylase [Mycobacterium sp. CBMA293]|uniref:bifunctional 3-(3-hydroxy-phenyl)propionate/3-hydroxycinnamic acid hydroxylase MhpA n=1 Tax=unclassified Mycolicibacterium TaxID=2636767 RepID=UPI0012DE31E9|nr:MULTISPECIES: bifunctional 3-(3-hydroxy-phenyl)propionate/3-hydroxycinnamic acid hydroxylase [unclassified Mycolicibacterium]MUL49670.1 bifunctional 3-(3-hydroxy-phenyl)propionate/3-hydroxycinnamic acid hydroxylase [Mycolicibacterium sp. CBMA 360]MUL60105.1 bifunctional 3-(3-hydroxy-phenyl)propionate/3-hydroxycinnamic acid hydroxylase [Mycolicibacterium sp. CBMA 335]MUL72892.1 bifunctional 3-(3-hydroxy-phenyl)propionate/3-hydroxycinnamic acid hydroxylase [Mycolicibacterium sp. CBMA 311]MUL96